MLWHAGLTGALDVSENGVEFADMRFPIPSDLALFDSNSDNAPLTGFMSGIPGGRFGEWILKIKAVGMVGTGARLADISGRDAMDNVATEDQRKFFYPPDARIRE